MRKCFLLFLAVFFLAFGCGKKSARQYGGGYEGGLDLEADYARTPGLGYDDSEQLFSGTSNLYGKMADGSTGSPAAASRSRADEPEFMAENVHRASGACLYMAFIWKDRPVEETLAPGGEQKTT